MPLLPHILRRPCRPVRPGRPAAAPAIAALVAAGLLATTVPAAAQSGDDRPIFRRFAGGREPARNWQLLFEAPVRLRPQTAPDAEIVANTGLNIVRSYQPQNRVYVSRSYGYAKSEWKAPERGIEKARVIQFDITPILNFWIERAVVLSFGVGLGLMDGLSVTAEDGFRTRLEPFIPVQLGLAVPLGSRVVVDAKVIQSSFFGPGPVLSATRGYLGIGFNY